MEVNVNLSGDFSQESGYTKSAPKVALSAYLGSKVGWVSFDEIRKDLADYSGATDGAIHQGCFDCGFTRVER